MTFSDILCSGVFKHFVMRAFFGVFMLMAFLGVLDQTMPQNAMGTKTPENALGKKTPENIMGKKTPENAMGPWSFLALPMAFSGIVEKGVFMPFPHYLWTSITDWNDAGKMLAA